MGIDPMILASVTSGVIDVGGGPAIAAALSGVLVAAAAAIAASGWRQIRAALPALPGFGPASLVTAETAAAK